MTPEERASAAIAGMADWMTPVYKSLHAAIVQAIAEEREACAQAISRMPIPDYWMDGIGWDIVIDRAVEAIRNRDNR